MQSYLPLVFAALMAVPAVAQQESVSTAAVTEAPAEEAVEETEAVEVAQATEEETPALQVLDASETSLEDFLWTARPIVIFADTPADEPSAQRRGLRRLRETWQVINDQIGDNNWMLGDKFSAADIYLFMLTTWLKPSRGQPSTDDFPNVKRIADAVMTRPSIQRVFEP